MLYGLLRAGTGMTEDDELTIQRFTAIERGAACRNDRP